MGNSLFRLKDRISDAVSNFFYPRDEYPDEEMQERRPRETRERQVNAPRPDQGVNRPAYQDQYRSQESWDMPLGSQYAAQAPVQGGAGWQPGPAAQQPSGTQEKQDGNLVYFPGAEEARMPREGENSVRVISVRAVTDCYSAITQLRQQDAVILVMDNVADPAEMRHFVDMLSGACYSLRATITKLSRHGVYLLCPGSMKVYVDRLTNQINSPSRQVPQNRYDAYMQQGYSQNAGYAPQGYAAQEAGYAPQGYAQQGRAQPPYAPPAQEMYYARGAAQDAETVPTSRQDYANGYYPDHPGREAL